MTLKIEMLGTSIFAIIFLQTVLASDLHVTKQPASPLDILEHPTANHNLFPPEVAFHCGYRNRYRNQETGEWITDKDIHATCLRGKLDILKYCRKVYPQLKVTNIAESEKQITIEDWCKESDVKLCKWSLSSNSYRCLVGEFESEALLVPKGCHFGHVDDPTKCKDFQFWNQTATLECSKHLGDLHVESFSILEPCGLDMFSGVEYVCCPRHESAVVDQELHVKVKLESDASKKPTAENKLVTSTASTNDDDDDADDDDDDNDEEDDDDDSEETDFDTLAITKRPRANHLLRFVTAGGRNKGATTTSASDSSLTAPGNAKKPEELLDIYFREADPEYEHDRYKEAQLRLERRHKTKVASIMKEWSELESRYNSMVHKDPNHARDFRSEMTARFQKTVAALEEEFKEQKRQLDEVHQQRVEATFNERKREAMQRYRDALADGTKDLVLLRALEGYIKSEEKDRIHKLNYYRHLLRTDPDQAQDKRSKILRDLREINLRINASIEYLKGLPLAKEAKIKKSASEFWKVFRAENTPDVDDETLLGLDYTSNERLLDAYEKMTRIEHAKSSQEQANKIAIDALILPTTGQPHVERTSQRTASTSPPVNLPTSTHAVDPKPLSPEAFSTKETMNELGKIIDDAYKSSIGISQGSQRHDPLIFDPVIEVPDLEPSIVDESKILDENSPFGSYAKHSLLEHQAAIVEKTIFDDNRTSSNYTYAIFGVAGVTLLVSVLIGTALLRRKFSNRGKGFIEVDAFTPEERHVAAMQGNGYENPTYKYFDDKI